MAFRQEILRRRESGEANYHEVPGWTQDGSPHFGSRSGQNLICIGGVVLVEGMLAFDAQKGKLLWQKQIRGYPSRWCSEKGDLILMASNAPQDNKIICIEPKTGKEIWSTPFGGAPNDTMLTVEDNLAVGRAPGVAFTDQRGEDTGHGLLAAWRLGPQGPTLLWRHDEKTGFKIPSKCQPVLIDGLVWCGVPDPPKPAYPVACFDAQTGKHLGTINVPSGRRPGDIMQLEDRLLILGDSAHIKNTAFWAWAGGQRFDVAGEPWVNPHPPTTPLYATITWPYVDGHLYVRGADGIYCYDLRKNRAVR
jgi:outer membrane protein assembly factor BamB